MNQKTTKQLDKLLSELEKAMCQVTPHEMLIYVVTTKGSRELKILGNFALGIVGNFVEQSVVELMRCEEDEREEKGIDTDQ